MLNEEIQIHCKLGLFTVCSTFQHMHFKVLRINIKTNKSVFNFNTI